MKRCSKCLQEKYLTSFFRSGRGKRRAQCITCEAPKVSARGQKNLRADRFAAIIHYSHGTLKCARCPESRYLCLELHHISGNGNRHRKQIGGSTQGFFRWLKKNGYPPILEVLCANCHVFETRSKPPIRGRGGVTPLTSTLSQPISTLLNLVK